MFFRLRDAAAWGLEFLGREGLLLATVVLLFLVLGGLGRGLGLPDLFWRSTVDSHARRHLARFRIGVALGVVLGADALIVLLVESAVHTWSREFFLRAFLWLSAAGGFAVVLVWLFGAYDRRIGGVRDPSLREAALLPLGAIFGLGVFSAAFPAIAACAPGWMKNLVEYSFLENLRNPELLEFHAAAGILVLFGGAFYVLFAYLSLTRWKSYLYPGSAVLVLLAIVGAVHGFVAFRWPFAQIPVYLALAAGYVLLNGRYRRARVPSLENLREDERRAGLIDDEEALEAWKNRHQGALPVLVVVAVDGGGARSALWTTVVLTRLEEVWTAFPRHVRIITGASGGVLGAALWTSTLADGPDGTPCHKSGGCCLDRDGLLQIAERGGLSAVAAGLVFRDILPPPLRFGPDRGRRLEIAWEEHCCELARPIDSLAAGEKEGWRPSLVFSPMIVEDGRRLLISNLDLGLLRNSGPVGNRLERYSLAGVQLFRKLPSARKTLSLSTAVRLQANFPWVLPSTELPPLGPCQPRLRVVDAGYYDETGVELACRWIFQNRGWLKAHTAGVLLIQSRDTSSIDRGRLPRAHRSLWRRGLDGLFTPLRATLSARDSTTWYRNDATVAALARILNRVGKRFFTTVVFELAYPASLSWSLTPGDAEKIRDSIDQEPNLTSMANLEAWCESRGVVLRAERSSPEAR